MVRPPPPTFVAHAPTASEVGELIGRQAGSLIRAFLAVYERDLETSLRAFHRTPAGARAVSEWLAAAEQRFPALVAELRGVAAGACVPFIDLALLNLESEIVNLSKRAGTCFADDDGEGDGGSSGERSGDAGPEHAGAQSERGTACSTLFVRNASEHDGRFVLGHNEDSGPESHDYAYFVDVRIGEGVRFVAYTYPGLLPGNAFGANAHQALTTNAQMPKRMRRAGVPRLFLNRAMYETRSVDELLALLRAHVPAGGFAVNVVRADGRAAHVIEVAPNAVVLHDVGAAVSADVPSDGHFNTYLYIESAGARVPQHLNASSMHRRARYLELRAGVRTHADVLRVLGDTGDAALPIFRTATPPDAGFTLITAMYTFDEERPRIDLYTGNPASTPVAGEIAL